MTTHAFEPELDQPAPRRARLRAGLGTGCGLWFLRLFILPHTLAGIWLLLYAAGQTLLYLGVLLVGTELEGRIVGKTEEKGKKGVTYHVEYAFTLDDREYRDRVSVESDDYAAMKEGDAVGVRALAWMPNSGHWARVPGQWPILTPLGYWGMALFWNGILSVFLWQAYYLPWLHRHLVRCGQPAAGIVREVKTRVGKGGHDIRVRYEFAVPAGHRTAGGVFAGAMTAPGQGDANPKVEEVVTVLYDPRRPKRNLMYRLAAYAAVGPAANP